LRLRPVSIRHHVVDELVSLFVFLALLFAFSFLRGRGQRERLRDLPQPLVRNLVAYEAATTPNKKSRSLLAKQMQLRAHTKARAAGQQRRYSRKQEQLRAQR
jgi:hypothetical protein